MTPLIQLQNFIVANYPPAKTWDRLLLAEWVAFMRDGGYIVTVHDDDESIIGLAAAYTVMNEESIDNVVDPEGSILFIDMLVGAKKGVLQTLGFALLDRFGMRPKIAWRRLPLDRIKIYSTKRVRRNLFRVMPELIMERK